MTKSLGKNSEHGRCSQPVLKKLVSISLVAALVGCGAAPQDLSKTKAVVLTDDRQVVAHYYFAYDDKLIGENFENYLEGGSWLRLVKCSFPMTRLNRLKANAGMHLDTTGTIAEAWKLSEFEGVEGCRALQSNLTSMVNPLAMDMKKATVPMALQGSGGGRSAGFLGKIAMPVQLFGSLIFPLWILSSLPEKTLTQIDNYLWKPIWNSFKWILGLYNPRYTESIDDLMRIRWKGGILKKQQYVNFAEKFKYGEPDYLKSLAQRFYKEAKKTSFFGKDKGAEFRAIFGETFEEAMHKIRAAGSTVLQDYPKLSAKWYKGPAAFEVEKKTLVGFKKATTDQVRRLADHLRNVDPRSQQSVEVVKNSYKELKASYRVLRPKILRMGNFTLKAGIYIYTAYLIFKTYDRLMKEDEALIIKKQLKKTSTIAMRKSLAKIKNDEVCADQFEEAMEGKNRKVILATLIHPDCGDFVKFSNNDIAKPISTLGYGNTEKVDQVWELNRILIQAVPEHLDIILSL